MSTQVDVEDQVQEQIRQMQEQVGGGNGAATAARCQVVGPHTVRGRSAGGSFSRGVRVPLERGLECVNVQLSGWELAYEGFDLLTSRVNVQIADVSYSPQTGVAEFTVRGQYHYAGDHPFRWSVAYTILSLR